MSDLPRRQFIKYLAATPTLLSGCANLFQRDSRAHVVIVGGGFGGASAAKTLRLLDSNLKITLIEPKASYVTCPGSNWLFAGLTDINKLTVDYGVLRDYY
jgi:sulfide dehydrogenase [flavocytochrome c] flavoprotein subunit